MRAAYKWRLQNGVYGYLTNENDNIGPFIYEVNTEKRFYYGATGEGVFEPVNDGQISYTVGGLSEDRYRTLFAEFTDMLSDTYPNVTLLDVTYYYNMENDECVESASSLKCSTTDIIFKVVEVTKGEEPSVTLDEINTSTANGDIEYDMHFVLPEGSKGDIPEVSATATATSLDTSASATATVTKGGTTEVPVFNFEFGIPRANGINEQGKIEVTGLDAKDSDGNGTHIDNSGITISNNGSETIIDATGITTTNVYTEMLSADTISTKQLNDVQITAESLDSGKWYEVYKCTKFPSTLRIGVTKSYVGAPYYPENYYFEVNFGYKGSSQSYSGDAKYNSISLLNGSFEGVQCITKCRVVSRTDAAYFEIYVANKDTNSGVVYAINNVEGCGNVQQFVVDSNSYASENSLALINGIATNKSVCAKEIIDKRTTFTPQSTGWYTIYKTDNKLDYGNYTAAKISIVKDWNYSTTEGYTLLLTHGSTGQEIKYDLSQLSGFIGHNGQHDLTKARIISEKDDHFEIQVYINKVDYTVKPTYTITLAEGVGSIDVFKNDGSDYTKGEEFTLTNGVKNNNITTNTLKATTVSSVTISSKEVVIPNNGNLTVSGTTIMTGNVNMSGATVTLPQTVINNISVPVGTIMMWPTATAPEGWRNCQGGSIALTTPISSRKIFSFRCAFNPETGEQRTGTYQFSAVSVENEKLIEVLGTMYTRNNEVDVQEDESIKTYFISLPNLSGKFPLGYNYAHQMATTGGTETVTLTTSQIPSHTHTVNALSTPGSAAAGSESVYAIDAIQSHTKVTGALPSMHNIGSFTSRNNNGELETYTPVKNAGGGNSHDNMPPYLSINFIIKYK